MFGVEDPATIEAVRAYVKLLRAHSCVLARLEPLAVGAGLTLTQLGVLEVLLHKGPLSQREIGRKVLTSAGNMTDVVDKLQARGLVRRDKVAGDRRQVAVALTEAGQALIEQVFPRHAADIAAAMRGLGAAELAQLGGLLRRLGAAAR